MQHGRTLPHFSRQVKDCVNDIIQIIGLVRVFELPGHRDLLTSAPLDSCMDRKEHKRCIAS